MRSRSYPIPILVVLVFALGVAGCSDDDCPTAPAPPVAVLDAHFEPEDLNLGSGVGGVDKALTFVVQKTGTLERVELLVSPPDPATDPLLVDIRMTNGGIPINDDGDILAISLVNPPDPRAEGTIWVTAEFGESGPLVTEGDVLAIGVRTSGGWSMRGNTQPGNPDSEGYFRNPGLNINTWTLMGGGGQDVGFRVYVLPE